MNEYLKTDEYSNTFDEPDAMKSRFGKSTVNEDLKFEVLVKHGT